MREDVRCESETNEKIILLRGNFSYRDIFFHSQSARNFSTGKFIIQQKKVQFYLLWHKKFQQSYLQTFETKHKVPFTIFSAVIGLSDFSNIFIPSENVKSVHFIRTLGQVRINYSLDKSKGTIIKRSIRKGRGDIEEKKRKKFDMNWIFMWIKKLENC